MVTTSRLHDTNILNWPPSYNILKTSGLIGELCDEILFSSYELSGRADALVFSCVLWEYYESHKFLGNYRFDNGNYFTPRIVGGSLRILIRGQTEQITPLSGLLATVFVVSIRLSGGTAGSINQSTELSPLHKVVTITIDPSRLYIYIFLPLRQLTLPTERLDRDDERKKFPFFTCPLLTTPFTPLPI